MRIFWAYIYSVIKTVEHDGTEQRLAEPFVCLKWRSSSSLPGDVDVSSAGPGAQKKTYSSKRLFWMDLTL